MLISSSHARAALSGNTYLPSCSVERFFGATATVRGGSQEWGWAPARHVGRPARVWGGEHSGTGRRVRCETARGAGIDLHRRVNRGSPD